MWNYTLCLKLHIVLNYTLCVKLHIVCKIKHWVKKYSLCVKSHTVCEITHILQDSTGVPFALNMEKIPLTLKFLHPRRGWRGRQISGMH